jgi:hypothetical protein
MFLTTACHSPCTTHLAHPKLSNSTDSRPLHPFPTQASLQFKDLYDEVSILQRLAYKNNNQHRSSKHYQAVRQVGAAVTSVIGWQQLVSVHSAHSVHTL